MDRQTLNKRITEIHCEIEKLARTLRAMESTDLAEYPENYEKLSEPYKRIRIAYIDAARKRPDEFKKRLESFIKKTRGGKLIVGFGGIDKYYG